MSAKMNKLVLCLAVLALMVLASCGGSSSNDDTNLDGVRPSISALSRGAANIGEQLLVLGLNFGDGSGSSVSLNGVEFTVNEWTDTRIDVTVASGMTSGIVVVSVNNLESMSGNQAQLFIPAAPVGQPVITGLNPGYGPAGAMIQIAGQGFGADQGAGAVMFMDAENNLTPAEIQVVDVGGVDITQWGNNSIKIIVPQLEQGTYTIYVDTGTAQSNAKGFTLQPPEYPAEAPVITDVTPGNGAVGTAITIAGDNFGHNQGTSQLMINGVPLDIVAWSYTVINALIPDGATTGKLSIKVGDHEEYQWPPDAGGAFVVANAPAITGVTPTGVRMGRSMTIYGRYFGAEQGEGTVRVGGTVQEAGEWHPTTDPDINMIEIPSVAPFSAAGTPRNNADGEPILDEWGNPMLFYEVVVTADNGLASTPEHVYLVTNLQAVVTVDPVAGQRDGGPGEEGTVFSFRPEVSGGSGDYTYTLIPDANKPGETVADQDPSTPGIVEYTYPDNGSGNKEDTYDTMMRIEDNETGDSLTIEGPQILVVQYGVPVITKIGVYDFNNGGLPAPNEWCYQAAISTYNDFAYQGDDVYFTSSRGGVLIGGNPLPSYVRNIGSFMSVGDNARGQGYRYYNDDAVSTNDGAVISVQGLNFGEAMGEVYLDAVGTPFLVSDYMAGTDLPTGWGNNEIRFFIPGGTFNLSGTVQVKPAGSTEVANSFEPLTCSAYVLGIAPDVNVPLNDTGVITLTGFDFEPNTVPNKVGMEEYSIWIVRASYTDPWGAGQVTNHGLLTTPVAPSSVLGTAMQFTMSDLDVDGDGTVPMEVTSASGTESAVVEGTLEPGDYFFFLWTGAITGDDDFMGMAHSGIFSEAYAITTTSGPGPGDNPPVAALSASTNSGEAPLSVTFNAGGSTDDGTITDYEWDFNGNGTYNEPGDEADARGDAGPHTYVYNADGTFTARVRVTDDATPTPQDDVATQTITVGIVGPGNTITVNVTMRDWENFASTSTSMVRLYNGAPPGGTLVDFLTLDHVAAGIGNAASGSFTDVPDGTDWYIRIMNIVIQWDGDGAPPPMATKDWGPITVGPNYTLTESGFQYQEPPGP